MENIPEEEQLTNVKEEKLEPLEVKVIKEKEKPEQDIDYDDITITDTEIEEFNNAK